MGVFCLLACSMCLLTGVETLAPAAARARIEMMSAAVAMAWNGILQHQLPPRSQRRCCRHPPRIRPSRRLDEQRSPPSFLGAGRFGLTAGCIATTASVDPSDENCSNWCGQTNCQGHPQLRGHAYLPGYSKQCPYGSTTEVTCSPCRRQTTLCTDLGTVWG